MGACDAMLELYVETYGALSKREKIDFILEQVHSQSEGSSSQGVTHKLRGVFF